MNEIEARETEYAHTQHKSSLSGSTVILIIVGVVTVVAASLLLYTQIGSQPGCSGEGSCMLYFYTDD
jgi:hypothetical protein